MTRLRALLAPLLVALLVAGCAAPAEGESQKGAGGILGATTWVLQTYDNGAQQVELPNSIYIDANFDQNHISGFAGCNTYGAAYVAIGSSIRISMVRQTLIACGEPEMDAEQAYIAAIQRSDTFTATRDSLRLFDIAGRVLASYTPAPENPLLGNWDVVGLGDGRGTVAAPVPGSQLTASFAASTKFLGIFGSDPAVSGSTGCNQFSGTYQLNDSTIRISQLAMTAAACADPALATQEQAYVQALQGVGRVEARGDFAELTSLTGGTLVQLQRQGTPLTPSPSPSVEPSPSAEPSASPSASPSPSPTPAPTPPPSVPPPATPPPGTPTPIPSPDPSALPSATAIPTTTCEIPDRGVTVTYPANWFTVTEPPELACRLFDEAPITDPPDETNPSIAIVVGSNPDVPWPNAFAAATDTNRWDLQSIASTTVSGLPAVRIEAISLGVEGDPYPAGTWRYLYLADRGANGTLFIETRGQPGDAYALQKQVVDLMAATILVPAPS